MDVNNLKFNLKAKIDGKNTVLTLKANEDARELLKFFAGKVQKKEGLKYYSFNDLVDFEGEEDYLLMGVELVENGEIEIKKRGLVSPYDLSRRFRDVLSRMLNIMSSYEREYELRC